MKVEAFLVCWVESEFFNEDLKMLYGLHLPTTEEWKQSLECVYHEWLPNCHENRSKYIQNYNFKIQAHETKIRHLVAITNALMDKKTKFVGSKSDPKKGIIPYQMMLKFLESFVVEVDGMKTNNEHF